MKYDVPSTTSLAALAGGALWAMANIFAIVFAPKPPDRRDVVRALVGSLFALIAAVIGGYFVAPWIVWHAGIRDVETISLIGLFVGMGFWASVPVVILVSSKFIPSMFGNLGSVLSTATVASAPSKTDPVEGEQEP